MLSIADLLDKVPQRTIHIRGKELQIKGLTLADRRLAREAAGDMPVAPLSQPLHKGSNAPFEPNVHDGKYRAALNRWGERLALMECVIALCADAKTPAEVATEANRLESVLTDTDILNVRTSIEQVEDNVSAFPTSNAFADGTVLDGGLANLIGPVSDVPLERLLQKDLPEKYGVTRLYLHLRLAERFGWGIVDAMKHMSPAAIETIEEYERLRQREESMMYQAKRS